MTQIKFHIASQFKKTNKQSKKNNNKTVLFKCQCIQHKSTNWQHYFDVSNRRWGHYSTWSSKPLHSPAAYRSKKVRLFLTKTLSVDLAPGIHPATSHTAVKRPID